MEKGTTTLKGIFFEVIRRRWERVVVDPVVRIVVVQIMVTMNLSTLKGDDPGDAERGDLLVLCVNVGTTIIAINMA
jgi:hypothetical protein